MSQTQSSQGTQVMTKRARLDKTRIRKKPYTKKKKFGIPSQVTYINGFPARMNIAHKFSYNFVLERVAGAPNYGMVIDRVRLNSLYDPIFAVGGNQPLYFAQMAALYNHYVVTKTFVKASFFNRDNVPSSIVLTFDDDGTTTSSLVTSLSKQPSATCGTASNAEVLILNKSWNANVAFGGDPLSNPSLKGTGATNPSESQILNVCAIPMDFVSSMYVTFQLEITYYAQWSELKEVAAT